MNNEYKTKYNKLFLNKNLTYIFPNYFILFFTFNLLFDYINRVNSQKKPGMESLQSINVVNIDNTGSINSYSSYIKNSKLGFGFYNEQLLRNATGNSDIVNFSYTEFGKVIKIGDTAKIGLVPKTYFSILNSFYLQKDGNNMTYLREYYLDFYVHSSVVPNDNFKVAFQRQKPKGPKPNNNTNINAPASIMEHDINCKYINSGIDYNVNKLRNFNFKKIQNLVNLNIGLTYENKLMRVIYASGDFNLYQLKEEINSNQNITLINERKFDDFWLINQPFELGSFIIGKKDNLFTFYNITYLDSYGGYKIRFYTEFDLKNLLNNNLNNNFNFPIQISNIGTFGDDIIISSLDGLIYLKKNNLTNNWESKLYQEVNFENKTVNLKIKDLSINNNTIYVLVENHGFKIFDLIEMKFLDFEFNHPFLYKIDTVFPPNSDYPLFGILVNNTSNEVNEFFIELKTSEVSEYEPQLNRIYLTGLKNNNNTNVVVNDTDFKYESFSDQLNQGIIYDRVNQKIYILTRGVPNYVDIYNYKIELNDVYNQLIDVDVSTLKNNINTEIFFLSYSVNKFNPAIVLKYSNQTSILINNFQFSNINFSCEFKRDGIYQMNFIYQSVCKNYESSFYDSLNSCPIFLSIPIIVQGGINVLMWIIIIVIVLLLFGLVIFIICCFKSKGNNRDVEERNIRYEQQDNNSKKDNVIEVQVIDNN